MSNFRNQIIPNMTKDLELWFNKLGEVFFRNLGVKEGNNVLDFGCGAGTYTIPVAKVVGIKGKVFAIDCEEEAIKEIKDRSKKHCLTNIITPIKTQGEFDFPIRDNSIDISLIYDVMGPVIVRGGLIAVEQLIKEISSVTKIGGQLSFAPKHIDNWKIPFDRIMNVINNYFKLENSMIVEHIHWDWLAKEPIYTFRKI